MPKSDDNTTPDTALSIGLDLTAASRTKDFLHSAGAERSIAREIAMGMRDLDSILASHGMSMEEFDVLKATPRFCSMLSEATAAWESAANAQERIKAKSLIMIEEALPEMFGALVSPFQALNHRVALLQQMTRLAGVGAEGAAEDTGGKVNITINMGDGQDLKVTQKVTPKVIDATAIIGDDVNG